MSNQNNNLKTSNVVLSDSSDVESLSARVYNTLQNKLFDEQDGGKKQKKSSRKKSSKRKSSKKLSKKLSKLNNNHKNRQNNNLQDIEGGNIMSDSITFLSENVLTKNLNNLQGGRRKSKKKSKSESYKESKKGSKKRSKKGSKKGSKRALPEAMQAFQKIVAHLSLALGGRSPTVLKLAKIVKDETSKSNPNLSPMDLAKKTNDHFDKNKEKFKKEFEKLKSEPSKPKSKKGSK